MACVYMRLYITGLCARSRVSLVRVCVFAGRVTGDDVWCAASLPTVKVISLFSPLPAAATRDRLTNTNRLDGRAERRRKRDGVNG